MSDNKRVEEFINEVMNSRISPITQGLLVAKIRQLDDYYTEEYAKQLAESDNKSAKTKEAERVSKKKISLLIIESGVGLWDSGGRDIVDDVDLNQLTDALFEYAKQVAEQPKELPTEQLKQAFKAGQSSETSADADQFDDSEFDEWMKSKAPGL